MNQDNINLRRRLRQVSLWSMAFVYIGAGLNHFWHFDFYRPLMPPWIPAHDVMIGLSGVIEVALGLALVPVRTRKPAAYAIIAMLVVFLNVHVYMVLARDGPFKDIPEWVLIARIPLQLVLIAWSYFNRGSINNNYSNASGNSSIRIGSP